MAGVQKQKRPYKETAPGTKSNPTRKPRKPGSGKGIPAKGYDQNLKCWVDKHLPTKK